MVSKSVRTSTLKFNLRSRKFCIFRIYLNTLSIHIRSENETIRSNHGPIIQGY